MARLTQDVKYRRTGMHRSSDMVIAITSALYDKGYTRGRVYEDGDVTITAYLKGGTVLLLQTVHDRATGNDEYSCLYQPVCDSAYTTEICEAIPD
jgi:hypothetical protein